MNINDVPGTKMHLVGLAADGHDDETDENAVAIALTDPHPNEMCPISMDLVANENESVLGFRCAQLGLCGHRFAAMQLLKHFSRNNMLCPICRQGSRLRLAAAQSFPGQGWAEQLDALRPQAPNQATYYAVIHTRNDDAQQPNYYYNVQYFFQYWLDNPQQPTTNDNTTNNNNNQNGNHSEGAQEIRHNEANGIFLLFAVLQDASIQAEISLFYGDASQRRHQVFSLSPRFHVSSGYEDQSFAIQPSFVTEREDEDDALQQLLDNLVNTVDSVTFATLRIMMLGRRPVSFNVIRRIDVQRRSPAEQGRFIMRFDEAANSLVDDPFVEIASSSSSDPRRSSFVFFPKDETIRQMLSTSISH